MPEVATRSDDTAEFKINGQAYGTKSDREMIEKLEKLPTDITKTVKTDFGGETLTTEVNAQQLATMMRSEMKALSGDSLTNHFNVASGVDAGTAHDIDMARRSEAATRIEQYRAVGQELITAYAPKAEGPSVTVPTNSASPRM